MRAAPLLLVAAMGCVEERTTDPEPVDTGTPADGGSGDGGTGDGGSGDGGTGMTDVDHDGLEDGVDDLIVAHPDGKVCWNDRLAPEGTLNANLVGITSLGVWTVPGDHPMVFEGGGSDADLWYCYTFPEGEFVLTVLSVEVKTGTGVAAPFDLSAACGATPDPACYGEGMGAFTCFAWQGGAYTWLEDQACRDVAP